MKSTPFVKSHEFEILLRHFFSTKAFVASIS
jgi:hypothetical protein